MLKKIENKRMAMLLVMMLTTENFMVESEALEKIVYVLFLGLF